MLKGLSVVNLSFCCVAHAHYLNGMKSSVLYPLPHDHRNKRKEGWNPVDRRNQPRKTRMVSFLEES